MNYPFYAVVLHDPEFVDEDDQDATAWMCAETADGRISFACDLQLADKYEDAAETSQAFERSQWDTEESLDTIQVVKVVGWWRYEVVETLYTPELV